MCIKIFWIIQISISSTCHLPPQRGESSISLESKYWYHPLPCNTCFKMIPNMSGLQFSKIRINLIMSVKIFLISNIFSCIKLPVSQHHKCDFPFFVPCHIIYLINNECHCVFLPCYSRPITRQAACWARPITPTQSWLELQQRLEKMRKRKQISV